MNDIVRNLRATRADMLGTEDEKHYWECHKAAEYIEELHDEIVTLNELAKLRYCDMQTKIERLEAVVDAAKYVQSCIDRGCHSMETVPDLREALAALDTVDEKGQT